jgi:hypothetical protein
MRQDDELFTRKSESYRKKHLIAVKALYGKSEDMPLKPILKRKVKRMVDPRGECHIQIKLVQWARNKGLSLVSIPNHGKRSRWGGEREVLMGLTKGVSDLFLAHPANGYAGFWIELKTKNKIPTLDQYRWLSRMKELGYQSAWFDDFYKAKEAIEQYLYGLTPCA